MGVINNTKQRHAISPCFVYKNKVQETGLNVLTVYDSGPTFVIAFVNKSAVNFDTYIWVP
jgi:hypothetical protein